MINASILGATGYTGIELIRILKNHKKVNIQSIFSKSYAGKPISEVYSGFNNNIDLICEDLTDIDYEKLCMKSDIVFLALPHGISLNFVSKIYEQKPEVKIIDLSADFRYDSYRLYSKWYEQEHPSKELLKKAVYGLPELFRTEISSSRVVANPGCYPTASILACAPLLAEKVIKPQKIIIDAKSGVSGAGRTPSKATHFSHVHNNFKAYKVTTHRHSSEITEKLSSVAEKEATVTFTPHLVPMQRGIQVTIYADPAVDLPARTEDKIDFLHDIYRDFYLEEPFIKIYDKNKLPETKDVYGTNNCGLTVRYDPPTDKIIIIGVIDNLCRGASGQAVQNMNILFDFEETTGLEQEFIF